MLRSYYQNNKSKIDKLLYILIMVGTVYSFFKFIFGYIAPFIFAYVLLLILNPLAIFLNKKLKLGKTISSLICCIIFICAVVFFAKTILSRIIIEGKYFFVNLPYLAKQFIIKIEGAKLKYNHILDILPQSVKKNLFVTAYENLSAITNKILKSSSAGIVKFIPHIFFNTIVTMLATFFFLKDKCEIENFLRDSIPNKILNGLNKFKKGCLCGITAYIKSELILMSITSVICTINFCIINYPYALFLGLITAIIDALPILGSGFIIWPWIFYCILNSNFNRAIILAATYLIVTIIRHTLSPKLIGNQIEIHPLIMLIAIYIGLKIFGVLGIIICPILVITSKFILEE